MESLKEEEKTLGALKQSSKEVNFQLRTAILVYIDLMTSRRRRLLLLPQRSSGRALLETRHSERLIHVPRHRSFVERKLTWGGEQN